MEQTRYLDDWAASILAHPVTKQAAHPGDFKRPNGIIDARVELKNTYGYSDWSTGQQVYEQWEQDGEDFKREVEAFRNQIAYDRPVYEHFPMTGDVLDVGGLVGTVREFLPAGTRFVSVDPFIDALERTPKAKREAYTCLAQPLNFLGGVVEFLPLQAQTFDWVHMRSMLDHVQVPDLALMEAHRVLRPDGSLLVGMYVEGGRTGKKAPVRLLKDSVKEMLEALGIDRYKDFHTWHPTYANLLKLIESNGFRVFDVFWQPHWNDQVVYVQAKKAAG